MYVSQLSESLLVRSLMVGIGGFGGTPILRNLRIPTLRARGSLQSSRGMRQTDYSLPLSSNRPLFIVNQWLGRGQKCLVSWVTVAPCVADITQVVLYVYICVHCISIPEYL